MARRQSIRLNEKPAGVRVMAPNGSTLRVSEERAEALLAQVGYTKAKSQAMARATVESDEGPEEEDETLDDMSVPDLKTYAKANGIDLDGATRKDDIIAAIEAAQGG
jgi:hypothetical protein